MPGPWSRTVTSPPLTDTSTGAPGGLHLTALSSRLPTARARRAREPLTRHGSRRDDELGRGRVAARALHGVVDELVETQLLRRLVRGLAGPARSTRSPTRIVRSSSWPRTEREDRGALGRAAARGARSSSSTLARIDVSGVRSSCEASATSWRWASREASSAPSIALKAAARRPGSSSAIGSMRWCRSPVAVTCSAAAVRRAERPRGRPRDADAESRRRAPTPPSGHRRAGSSAAARACRRPR